MSEALSAPTSNTASGETEAQRRRRVRQERILNRGGDRLGRIRETLGAAQEEADKSDLGIVGGHELKTETVATTHVAGISLDSPDEPNGAAGAAPKLRRRAGNLGRKARLEAGNTSEDSATRLLSASASGVSSDPGDDIRAPIARPAVRGADVDGTPLRDVVEDAIADPCTDTLPPGLFVSARRFSAIGLSRAVVKLVP
ncbi:hypothetical protein GGI24_006508, partial [Coemansia furcata]